MITPPITFGTYAMARPIIGLIYPLSQFDNAVVVLQILGLGFFPLFYNILIATIVIAVDRQRYWSFAAIACAVINPAINLVLIPHYQSTLGNGGVGAAWATNAVELLLLAVGLGLLPRSLLAKREWIIAGKTTLAGLVMLGVILGLQTANLAEAIVVGAVTYAAGCLVLGVASSNQLRGVLALRDWTADAAADRQGGG
jgi:O-antigen/teichoic acid export membrane protein